MARCLVLRSARARGAPHRRKVQRFARSSTPCWSAPSLCICSVNCFGNDVKQHLKVLLSCKCRSHRRRCQQAAQALHDVRKIGTLCRLPLPALLHQRTVGVQASKAGAVWAGQGVPLRDGRALPPRQTAHNLRSEVGGRKRQGRFAHIQAAFLYNAAPAVKMQHTRKRRQRRCAPEQHTASTTKESGASTHLPELSAGPRYLRRASGANSRRGAKLWAMPGGL